MNKLVDELNEKMDNLKIIAEPIVYHCGSLHVYERHFKFLNGWFRNNR